VTALPSALNRKLNRTFLSRDSDIQSLFFDNFGIFPVAMQTTLFSPSTKDRINDLNPYTRQNGWIEQCDAKDVLDKLLYVDTRTYLHELLMKQDQMSMAASIESRVPFLDHKLVEFTARMPREMKLRNGSTKWILREAMKGVLPAEVLNRPKMGFPVPMARWLRTEFKHVVDEYVISERALSRGIFDADFVLNLVARHNSGEDHSNRIFRLINFEIWVRSFIEGENVQATKC
ncbi:MAG: asparagine synthetase B family protein, partial [Pyrinomonadaceae bacterium]